MSENKKRKNRRRKKSKFDFYGFVIKIAGSVSTTALILILISSSWQFIQNPFLVLASVTNDLPKTHKQTWNEFGAIFTENETTHLPSTFLAALAQTESSGRQWTSSDWTFSVDRGPLKLLAPESTSFGLMQFTKPTFELAKDYCVNGTKVEQSKPWYMLDGCWFTSLKTRASASDSIEIAAAYLQNYINQEIIYKKRSVSKRNAQRFAAITHLCGVGVARKFVRNNFFISQRTKCGSHDLSYYLKRVFKNKRAFDTIESKLFAMNESKKTAY